MGRFPLSLASGGKGTFQNGLPPLKSCPETQESQTSPASSCPGHRIRSDCEWQRDYRRPKCPLHFLRAEWILTAGPTSPSELGQTNPSPKSKQWGRLCYTLGTRRPFPRRGLPPGNIGAGSQLTLCLCNSLGLLDPGAGGGGLSLSPASDCAQKGPGSLRLSLLAERRWGRGFAGQKQYGLADGEEFYRRKDIGQKLKKEWFFFSFEDCLQQKSGNAREVRWIKMTVPGEAGQGGGRESRAAGPRSGNSRAENGCVSRSWVGLVTMRHRLPGFHEGEAELPGLVAGTVGYFQTAMEKLVKGGL